MTDNPMAWFFSEAFRERCEAVRYPIEVLESVIRTFSPEVKPCPTCGSTDPNECQHDCFNAPSRKGAGRNDR